MAFEMIQTPLERKLSEALDAASAYFMRPNASGIRIREPLSRDRVLSTRKTMPDCKTRQWCMAYLRWKYPEMSQPRTGRIFGRHHTTVLHAERRARELFPDAVFCPLPDLLDREGADAA